MPRYGYFAGSDVYHRLEEDIKNGDKRNVTLCGKLLDEDEVFTQPIIRRKKCHNCEKLFCRAHGMDIPKYTPKPKQKPRRKPLNRRPECVVCRTTAIGKYANICWDCWTKEMRERKKPGGLF